MKVAIVTAHMSRAAGGVAECVKGLAQGLAEQRVDARIVGVADDQYPEDAKQWGDSADPHLALGPRAFGWAPSMRNGLTAFEPDVTDAQGLWMYPSLANLRHAKMKGRPYVVTPHGMLDPWAVGRARWKKRLVATWFERAHLERAACIRAIAPAEVRAIRAFGLRNPVALVPNGVDLPIDTPAPAPAPSEPRTLLFLGRIDPKKGVAELLRAWAAVEAEARASGWRLQVTGWGHPKYVTRMQALVRELELSPETFVWTGPRYGEAKAACYRDASAFVLPSASEGLPMAVLEAWSYRLPALLTDACNLPSGFEVGAARRIEPTPASIANGIRDLMRAGAATRSTMGTAGRRLVETQFTWPIVAAEMLDTYRWVTANGPRPSCVTTA